MKFSMVNILVRLEGLAVFVASIILYVHFGGTWGMSWLVLAPDLGLLAFFVNTRFSSSVYNLFHFYAIPLACIAFHLVTGQGTLLFLISFLWTAHIGIDRLVGFGLKYPTQFKDTHIQRI